VAIGDEPGATRQRIWNDVVASRLIRSRRMVGRTAAAHERRLAPRFRSGADRGIAVLMEIPATTWCGLRAGWQESK
jgi:hypothetical protein